MYIQEISINIQADVDKDDAVEEFMNLMYAYRSSGQTQGKIESRYIEGGRIVSLPFTLEKDALDTKFNNYYVNEYAERVEAFCKAKLFYRTAGKVYDGYEGACKCEKSDFYILITNYLSIDSPITCGNCKNTVPLYKLPVYYDYGYMPVLSWESNYNACDTLQMNGEVGERWALNQMQELKSQLSKQGLKICRKIEELTGIPVYYYLHNYRKNVGNECLKLCPGCGMQWHLKTPLHASYNFKCDDCKLLSVISPNS